MTSLAALSAYEYASVSTGTSKPKLTFRLATTKSDLEQAFQLVWKAYVGVGLQSEDDYRIRLTKYHLLPSSKVFVAVEREPVLDRGFFSYKETVVGTVTVIEDGALGLPVEEVCAEDIRDMRDQGERIAEIVALASATGSEDNRTIIKLFRLAHAYCARQGVTKMLASLTERHIGFYRRFVDFKPLGELSAYSMANGLAVQAHYLDMQRSRGLVEKRSSMLEADGDWRTFLYEHLESTLAFAASTMPWTPGLLRHFGVHRTDLISRLDESSKDALVSAYSQFGAEFAV